MLALLFKLDLIFISTFNFYAHILHVFILYMLQLDYACAYFQFDPPSMVSHS